MNSWDTEAGRQRALRPPGSQTIRWQPWSVWFPSRQGPPRVKQLTPKPAPAYQDREAVDPQIYDKSNRMNGAEAGIRYV